jgi:zinc/manganese transport system permease protein
MAALFLYWDTTVSTTTGASTTILFGSMFELDSSTVPVLVAFAVVALLTVVILYRVLLLSSLNSQIAATRGVPVRTVGVAFLIALAVSVSLSAVVIGAVLSTALLIGPAATALRVTRGPVAAMVTAAALGAAATWIGIILAYDSYYWPPKGHGWPVSFFVVALVFVFYLLTRVPWPARAVLARTGRKQTEDACSPA